MYVKLNPSCRVYVIHKLGSTAADGLFHVCFVGCIRTNFTLPNGRIIVYEFFLIQL